VIEGFTESGEPKLRPPKRDVTTRMLPTHSAGMGYDFFNEKYNRLAQEKGQPSVITSSKKALMTPLLFDPGDKWEYGSNIDWCGQVIEGITGKRLGEVFKTRIFEPLGMRDTTFELTDALRQRVAGMHARNADGSLAPMDFELPSQPEVHMGGHGLYSTCGRLHALHPHVAERRRGRARPRAPGRDGPDGGEESPRRQEGHDAARGDPVLVQRRGVLPRTVEIVGVDVHGQRRGGAHRASRRRARLGRIGESFLLDRSQERLRGFWATQILPFGDPVSFGGYIDFETALYNSLRQQKAA
jgi:methyl acetate hydrolase